MGTYELAEGRLFTLRDLTCVVRSSEYSAGGDR